VIEKSATHTCTDSHCTVKYCITVSLSSTLGRLGIRRTRDGQLDGKASTSDGESWRSLAAYTHAYRKAHRQGPSTRSRRRHLAAGAVPFLPAAVSTVLPPRHWSMRRLSCSPLQHVRPHRCSRSRRQPRPRPMPTPDAAARSAVPTSTRALASRASRHAECVARAVHRAAFDTFAVSLCPPTLYCDFECLRLALLTTARANVEPTPPVLRSHL
jgi:hypothetical protein